MNAINPVTSVQSSLDTIDPSSNKSKSLDNASVYLILTTIVLSLFIFIPSAAIPFLATKTYVLAAGAIITLVVYILARLGRGNIVLPQPLLVGALWLPVIAYLLSAISSGMFKNALWGASLEPDTLGLMLIIAVLGTLTALVLRRSEHYRSYLKVSGYAFSILVVLQIAVLIVGQFMPKFISPGFSIIGSYDNLAYVLGLGVIGSLIAIHLFEVSDAKRKVLNISIIGALILLVIANSILVWTLVAITSLGLFIKAVMRNYGADSTEDEGENEGQFKNEEDSVKDRSLVMPLCILALSLFFIIDGMVGRDLQKDEPTLGVRLASALNVSVGSVRPSLSSTIVILQKTYATSSIFGSGPGTFGFDFLKHRDTSLNMTPYWSLDFSYGVGFIPTSFVTTGIVGIMAWAILLILFIFCGLRTIMWRASEDMFIRSVSIFSFISSVYLITIAIFTLPSTTVLALTFVSMGLFISTTRFAVNGQQYGIVFSRNARIGFVIVFFMTILLLASVAAAYTVMQHYLAESKIASASRAFQTADLDAIDKALKSSISFAPSSDAYQIQAYVANVRINQILSSSTMPAPEALQAFKTALQAGIDASVNAQRLSPLDYRPWVMLGNLYAQAVPLKFEGAYKNAKFAYENAQALNPVSPQMQYLIAKLNIANKDNKSARENLKAAIVLKQDYVEAILLLSQLEVQEGSVKAALDVLLATAAFTPNNPSILFQAGILYAAQDDFASAIVVLAKAVELSPKFANARYFLSAVYAKKGEFTSAITQMQAISDSSSENAIAVAKQLEDLKAGKNPFPRNLLSISPVPVEVPAPAASTTSEKTPAKQVTPKR